MSTRLADPPTGDRIDTWLRLNPDLEFKLDPTPAWTETLVEHLAATDAVRTLDLKGHYEGTDVDQSADSELYELVVEDPELTDETRPLFGGHEEPESPNDVAPRGYNDPTPGDELASSPLSSPGDSEGTMWKTDTSGNQ